MFKISHSNVLFILGVLGILFYITAPILFPHVENIRQPELLPVYSLMIGLGGLLRRDSAPGDSTLDKAPKELKDDKKESK